MPSMRQVDSFNDRIRSRERRCSHSVQERSIEASCSTNEGVAGWSFAIWSSNARSSQPDQRDDSPSKEELSPRQALPP